MQGIRHDFEEQKMQVAAHLTVHYRVLPEKVGEESKAFRIH